MRSCRYKRAKSLTAQSDGTRAVGTASGLNARPREESRSAIVQQGNTRGRATVALFWNERTPGLSNRNPSGTYDPGVAEAATSVATLISTPRIAYHPVCFPVESMTFVREEAFSAIILRATNGALVRVTLSRAQMALAWRICMEERTMSNYKYEQEIPDFDFTVLSDSDALNQLRSTVEDWVERARKAVWTFEREMGLFQKDSEKSDHSSITTTARCYMALAYVERHRAGGSGESNSAWRPKLNCYLRNKPFAYRKETFVVSRPGKSEIARDFNNFEMAHLADFVFAKNFAERFKDKEEGSKVIRWPSGRDGLRNNGRNIADKLLKLVSEISGKVPSSSAEIPFDEDTADSGHYFVTLHVLRALQILSCDGEANRSSLAKIANEARRFCIEQCFYCQRNIRHKQDPARLVFASTLYCMYADEVDQEIMIAITESIAAMQELSGKWPASHPIVRKRAKGAWYIASSELALCLTWLYFLPRVPDTARRLILLMLERHFRNWIVPTHRELKTPPASDGTMSEFSGWSDDSAIGEEKVVGWTTAIVCHLLTNYVGVLDDYINRAVIENLKLENIATDYLVDETTARRNTRWTHRNGIRPWPDLPPIAWEELTECAALAKSISESWSDPEEDELLSRHIGTDLLFPILSKPTFLPDRDMVAGILDGPPGTRKTTLVREIAKVLKWPYVPVPASVIFDSGFDNMEARASAVFRCLNYLTRCVIFFDEFEEFFRDRREELEESQSQGATDDGATICEDRSRFSPHDRTIAAFTTSAMLPRVQDLHDGARSLVFLATNHFDKLDDAIVRSGRFDFRETINHPLVGRFKENGYFSNPPKKTLALLRTEKASDDLSTVRRIIEDALEMPEVKALLCKIKPKPAPGGSRDDRPRVPFFVVENAARHLMVEIRGGKEESALTKSASCELCNSLRKLVDQEKGPGQLPGRANNEKLSAA